MLRTHPVIVALKAVLLFLRVGEKIFLRAHDVENCQELEGCVEVNITEIWFHEFYRIDVFYLNDIAVVK